MLTSPNPLQPFCRKGGDCPQCGCCIRKSRVSCIRAISQPASATSRPEKHITIMLLGKVNLSASEDRVSMFIFSDLPDSAIRSRFDLQRYPLESHSVSIQSWCTFTEADICTRTFLKSIQNPRLNSHNRTRKTANRHIISKQRAIDLLRRLGQIHTMSVYVDHLITVS